MNKQILVDTNVFIYAIDQDSKFHNQAFEFLSNTDLKLFTTSKNITETLVVLTRDEDLNLSIEECIKLLEDILVDIVILYPNELSLKIFFELVCKYNAKGLWIHDIEIASIALAYGIDRIATKNIKDFSKIEEISIVEI